MVVKSRSLPAGCAVAVLIAGLILTGCGTETAQDQNENPPPSTAPRITTSPNPGSTQTSTANISATNLDELFQVVDEYLDCPVDPNGVSGEAYLFDIDGSEELEGRQCGESIVMAWSDNPSLIQGVRDLLSSADENVPMAGTTEWVVADVSEAGKGGTGAEEHQAASKDLEGFAAATGADYTG